MKICSVDQCGETQKLKGLCAYHYGRMRYKGDFPLHPSKRIHVIRRCKVVGCISEVQAASLCMKHYQAFNRWRRKNPDVDVTEYVVKESVIKKRPPIGTFL